MKQPEYLLKYGLSFFCCLVFFVTGSTAQSEKADIWLTTPDKVNLFTRQDNPLQFDGRLPANEIIEVNSRQTYQYMDGFGFALTGGSADHIIQMDAASRSGLLHEVFGTAGNAIGVSYLRISIGSSDLNDHVFSYDDLPEGETDTAMQKFDLGPDRKNVIPVLKEILTINPSVKILGSPWSPPAWMKTNDDTRGGRLLHQYYKAYAKYFVKYLEQMKAAGITVDAITVQNEPLHPGNNPSLLLTAPEEKDFVKNDLGPAFRAAGIKTKILIYDHNADRPDYPISVLDDPKAAKYIDGSAFHLYGGKIEALNFVHDAHPDKNIYFTEQMIVQFHDTAEMIIAAPVSRVIIGATRNWCKNVLEWNLAAGPDFKPYTDRGGCSMCQGAVTINGNGYTKNIAYYSMAHISRFVRPGSVHIASNEFDSLHDVAFATPEGKIVLIVSNDKKEPQTFSIKYNDEYATATLPAKAVATYIWRQ
ncbi:MAG TPA: glycoside hydrolase family 30 beta sandwich domain-containing protein [Chitinophagaceae bacterium]|nr:glycoside hydrolase family 30 beta sandwich domain-containing protein [Chitinophagaceae bacterium]